MQFSKGSSRTKTAVNINLKQTDKISILRYKLKLFTFTGKKTNTADLVKKLSSTSHAASVNFSNSLF